MTTMHQVWEEIRFEFKDLNTSHMRLLKELQDQAPTDTSTVDSLRSGISDIFVHADRLRRKLEYYHGYISGQAECSAEAREAPDIWGNTVLSITRGTAPCGEIGAALCCAKRPEGLSATQISAIARRLNLAHAGSVEWEMADGSTRTAKTYDLDQWQKITGHAISAGFVNAMRYEPPYRLREKQ